MSNTPETDAAEWSWDDDCTPENEMIFASDFVRKLERERDESLEWQDILERERDEARSERDAAREAWYEMHSSFERSRDEVEKLIRERDEARQEINNIRNILSQNGERIGYEEYDFSTIEMIKTLIRERDVANEELNKKCIEFDKLFDAAEQIRIERDEARSSFRELWKLAEPAITVDAETVNHWSESTGWEC